MTINTMKYAKEIIATVQRVADQEMKQITRRTQPNTKNPTKPDTDTDTETEADTDTEAGTENDKKTIKAFKDFYSCYPGTKRSPGTEYENFTKQNRNIKYKIVHLLLPALEKEKQFRIKRFELN